MATCSSCGKVCIIQQERSFTTAADSCDVQLTLDDSQTPGVLSASLVVDDDPTNLLAPGTCGWSVPEAAIISVIDANICTILSDQSINCFGDVDTTTTPPTSGQFMAWNGTQWVPATLPAGTAVNIEDTNGNVTVLNGNGNIPLASTGNVGYVTGGELVIPGAILEMDIVYSTIYTTSTTPGAYGSSPNLISQTLTNSTGEDRVYMATMEGFESATSPLTKAQVYHQLSVSGVGIFADMTGAFGDGSHNVDNAGVISVPFTLANGSSVNITGRYSWQNTQGTSWTFNGYRLRLKVISVPME